MQNLIEEKADEEGDFTGDDEEEYDDEDEGDDDEDEDDDKVDDTRHSKSLFCSSESDENFILKEGMEDENEAENVDAVINPYNSMLS